MYGESAARVWRTIRQALRWALPPLVAQSMAAWRAKSPEICFQTKWKESLVNHIFSPPPVTEYEPVAGSNSAEPGLAGLPVSPWFSKRPSSAPATDMFRNNSLASSKHKGKVVERVQRRQGRSQLFIGVVYHGEPRLNILFFVSALIRSPA